MNRTILRDGAALGSILLGLLCATNLPLQAQQDDTVAQARTQFAAMQRVTGEVTAIAGAKLTVKTEDGSLMQVVTTDNTRVMKGRGGQSGTGGMVKFADLKVGDGVVAAGNLDAPNKTLHAALIVATDAAQVKAMRENLGKTYIAGRVTAIDLDDAKLTLERPDRVSQTIGFDETTSFKRGGRVAGGANAFNGAGGPPPTMEGGESITLADIKVGDNVSGAGSVKAGMFVPTQLVVAAAGNAGGGRGRRGGPNGAAGSTGAAAPPR